MNTELKHEYELKEGDQILVGPGGRVFLRTFNPRSPDETLCAVVKASVLTQEQRTVMAWLVRIASTYRAVANTEERSEIKAACAEAEKMMKE